jgi:hypothetical protein
MSVLATVKLGGAARSDQAGVHAITPRESVLDPLDHNQLRKSPAASMRSEVPSTQRPHTPPPRAAKFLMRFAENDLHEAARKLDAIGPA